MEMIDSISASNESMSHLKAVYLVRPTSENVQKLRYQLANPRFGEYHLCMYSIFFFWSFLKTTDDDFMNYLFFFSVFSNLLKDTQIHILADSDEHEVVQQVQVDSLLSSSMNVLNDSYKIIVIIGSV